MAAPLTAWSAQAATPNVVLIVADDLGYGDLSSFGATDISTPSIDQLADQGIRFTSFYGAPVCQLFRAGLLTGAYAPRVSLATPVIPSRNIGLAREEITVAELLKTRGYATGAFGKWHLGDRAGLLPPSQGFDEFFGLPYSNDMWPFHPDTCPHSNEHPRLVAARQRARLAGFTGLDDEACFEPGFFPALPLLDGTDVIASNPDQALLNQRFTERALAFIDRHQDTPFFVYLSLTAPHVPLFPAPGFVGSSGRDLYGDVVQEIDWRVGQVLARLDALGLGHDTLVVFTSDNGPWLEYGIDGGSAGPLRDGKGSNYEGGIRVPMVMRWPASIPQQAVNDEPTSHVDLFATLASITGANLPSDRVTDGRDISPLMFGQPGATTPHQALYYYGETFNPDADQSLGLDAMRQGQWKLHVRMQGNRVVGTELYNLDADIDESQNLLTARPAIVQSMVSQAQAFNDALRANVRPYGLSATTGGGLSGSADNSPGEVVLSSVGSMDWVHWGLSSPGSVNRRAGAGTTIGTMVPVGNAPGRFQSNARVDFRWSAGTPVASASTGAGLYFSGIGSGASLTAPAGPEPRVLKLYLGGWRAQGQLQVSLSDGSAPDYQVSMENQNGVFDRVVTLAYSAASTGQALEVRYVMTGGTGNVTLSAAALAGDTVPVNLPPIAGNDSAAVNRGASVDINVLSDDSDPEGSLDPASVVATPPQHGTVQNLGGGILRYTHDGGSTTSDSFTYTVRDNQGAVSNPATVSITVHNPGAGALNATSNAAPGTVNLSTAGPADWVHWALSNGNSVNRKAGVVQQIGTLGTFGSNPQRFPGNGRTQYLWSGGTPTTNAATRAGLYLPGQGSGFTLAVPADTQPRTLHLYLGGWRAQGQLQASLSDGSAADVQISLANLGGVFDRVVSVTYRAGSADQTLNLRYTRTGGTGNLTLSAAALESGGSVVNLPPVANDDAASVERGQSVDVPVLNGDSDPEGSLDPTSVVVTAPQHGTVLNLGGGLIRYTHDGGPSTSDSFTYTVRDTQGHTSNVATVDILITQGNQPPRADDDNATVNQGAFVDIPVLDGDVDPEGDLDPQSIQSNAPAHGTLQDLGAGILRYTHDGGPSTSDSFRYTVRDGLGALSNSALVSITIHPASNQPTLTGTSLNAPGTVNLTTAGTSDWVHWALDSANSVSRKAGVVQQIGTLGSAGSTPRRFPGNGRTQYLWSDGTPPASGATRAGLYLPGQGSAFTLAVPADTHPRTLHLYLGGWRAQGQLQASLSDGSAADFQISLANLGGVFDRIVTLTYRAGSADQTLNLRYALTGGTGNLTLSAAALEGGGPTVNLPPVADDDETSVERGQSVDVPVLNGDSDPEGSLDPASVVVTAPQHGTVQNLGGGLIRYTHDGGSSTSDAFTYTVRDAEGNLSNVATVSVIIVAPDSGALGGSAAVAPGSVNLANQGPEDWVHWGFDNAGSINRKATSATLIGALGSFGATALRFPGNGRTQYLWSGGTPTANGATHAGLYLPGQGSGFTLTVPADTEPRTLRLYLGGWRAQGQLEASLSDGSAADFQVTMANLNGVFDRIVTLTFRAGSTGQTLNLRYTMSGGTGNVTLSAAAIE